MVYRGGHNRVLTRYLAKHTDKEREGEMAHSRRREKVAVGKEGSKMGGGGVTS